MLVQKQHVETVVNVENLKINDIQPTHNQPFLVARPGDKFKTVEFQDFYIGKNTYIISPLGSGKTELIKTWMDSKFTDKNICYITFRRTLTT